MAATFEVGDKVRFEHEDFGALEGKVCQAFRAGKGVGVFANGGVHYVVPERLMLAGSAGGVGMAPRGAAI